MPPTNRPARSLQLPHRAAQRTYRPTPIGEQLARAEFVAGLRTVFQRIRLETITLIGETGQAHLLDVAAVLRDVGVQFDLTAGEVEDILAEYAERIGLVNQWC